MKRYILAFAAAVLCCIAASAIPSRPSPARLVNDLAGLFTDQQETELERMLVAFDDSTSNQIAVVTVNDLEGLELSFNGTMLKATNTTDQPFKNVTVYYKTLHEDGNFLGGITYMTVFGDLEPGRSAEKIAGHFHPDRSQIVRIGYTV